MPFLNENSYDTNVLETDVDSKPVLCRTSYEGARLRQRSASAVGTKTNTANKSGQRQQQQHNMIKVE